MLSVWRAAQKSGDATIRPVVEKIWLDFYLAELEHFYIVNKTVAEVEHGLQSEQSNTYLDCVAASYVAFWHVGRLGLLIWAIFDRLPSEPEEQQKVLSRLGALIDTLNSLIRNNPGALRPVLDINHIELFLLWRAHWAAKQYRSIDAWIGDLGERLLMRRLDKAQPHFISGSNSWEIALEQAAGERGRGFGDSTSNLLLMILEFICGLSEPSRGELMRHYFLRIVQGVADNGGAISSFGPIDLMSWAPPADWPNCVLETAVFDGVAIPAELDPQMDKSDLGLATQLALLANEARKQFPLTLDNTVPPPVFVLACLKHMCPIPPELWRSLILVSQQANAGAKTAESGDHAKQ
jgi:hypothetical protein